VRRYRPDAALRVGRAEDVRTPGAIRDAGAYPPSVVADCPVGPGGSIRVLELAARAP